jgi:hypothetical protein
MWRRIPGLLEPRISPTRGEMFCPVNSSVFGSAANFLSDKFIVRG